MAVRLLLIFVCICLAIDGCKEPFEYESYPLAVTALVNHVSNQTQSFTYRKRRLSTYKTSGGTTASKSMVLHYEGDRLVFITNDSTQYSYGRTVFYDQGNGYVIDSTFFYRLDSTSFEVDSTALRAVRTVNNNADGKPLLVTLQTWTLDTETKEVLFAEEHAELTWQDDNVEHLTNSDYTTGERIVTRDISIRYDGKYCVYMNLAEYLYTLTLKDLYWLSSSNPAAFGDVTGERPFSYNYNKIGYPSSFQSDTGTTYGVTYTQIR